jgi:hypothetical protein
MNDYKNKLSGFAEKLKTSSHQTPMQSVSPVLDQVKKKDVVEKSALNIWIPKTLKKQMKQKEIDLEMTLTDIAITAISEFLNKSNETHKA